VEDLLELLRHLQALPSASPQSAPAAAPVTVEDIAGPWIDSAIDSGLMVRCKEGWRVPLVQLSNIHLVTYLRQGIALSLIIPEASARVAAAADDGTELFKGELAEALQAAQKRPDSPK
jgi:hypothetical protein